MEIIIWLPHSLIFIRFIMAFLSSTFGWNIFFAFFSLIISMILHFCGFCNIRHILRIFHTGQLVFHPCCCCYFGTRLIDQVIFFSGNSLVGISIISKVIVFQLQHFKRSLKKLIAVKLKLALIYCSNTK